MSIAQAYCSLLISGVQARLATCPTSARLARPPGQAASGGPRVAMHSRHAGNRCWGPTRGTAKRRASGGTRAAAAAGGEAVAEGAAVLLGVGAAGSVAAAGMARVLVVAGAGVAGARAAPASASCGSGQSGPAGARGAAEAAAAAQRTGTCHGNSATCCCACCARRPGAVSRTPPATSQGPSATAQARNRRLLACPSLIMSAPSSSDSWRTGRQRQHCASSGTTCQPAACMACGWVGRPGRERLRQAAVHVHNTTPTVPERPAVPERNQLPGPSRTTGASTGQRSTCTLRRRSCASCAPSGVPALLRSRWRGSRMRMAMRCS